MVFYGRWEMGKCICGGCRCVLSGVVGGVYGC